MSIKNTWTPVPSYVTVGTSSWAISTQTGTLWQEGSLVVATFNVIAVPTNGSGAGILQITGLNIPNGALIVDRGPVSWGGITMATAAWTDVSCAVALSTGTINFVGSGSGVAPGAILVADVPTGGTVNLKGTILFLM